MNLQRVLLFAVTALTALPAAADWSSCASDLSKLQRLARDASDAAESLDSKKSEYDDTRQKYDQCRRYPDTYDVNGDGCASVRSRAMSAESEYRNAVSDLQSQLDDVRTYEKRVESSCSDDSGVIRPRAEVICTRIQQLKGKVADADLLAACKTSLPEAVCKACLGLQ